ncbi:MAG TPA: biotin/lipoyl-containing protein [Candidatus Caenarcaniphilales bacterium]|nr:biotin/lipoyl-containing protein [Candidatus Caenarcaniphilales bacterium]
MTNPVDHHVALPVGPDDGAVHADAGSGNGVAAIARLANDLLPTLITRVGTSTLGELEVRQDGWRIRLRRRPLNGAELGAAVRRSRPGERRPERRAEASVGAFEDGGSVSHGEVRHRGNEPEPGVVSAPGVGYYLPREEVSIGTSVRSGDLLGHVDVLGVLVDVVVPNDGRVTRLLAEPGEAVEFGQPLARLENENRD